MDWNRYTPVPPIPSPSVDQVDSNIKLPEEMEMEDWRRRMEKLKDMQNHENAVTNVNKCALCSYIQQKPSTLEICYRRTGE